MRQLIAQHAREREQQDMLDQQHAFAQQQQEQQRELDMIQHLVQSGGTGKDVRNIAPLLTHTSGSMLNAYSTIADLADKKRKQEQQVSEAMNPQLLSTLGQNIASQPGANGKMIPAPQAAGEAAGNTIAQQILSLNQAGRADLIPQLMSTVGAARFSEEAKAQAGLAGEKRNLGQTIALNRATTGIKNETDAIQSEATAIAGAQSGLTQGVDISPAAIETRLQSAGVANPKLAARQALQLAGGDAVRIAQWQQGGQAGKNDRESYITARLQQLTDPQSGGYPNLEVTPQLRANLSLEALGKTVQDPVDITGGQHPTFIPSYSKEAAEKLFENRRDLQNALDQNDIFQQHYQDVVAAQKAGRLAGGPMQTGSLYDTLSTLGVQVPEVRVYQADLFNQAMALLRQLRAGRITNQEITAQLLTFPTIAEIGTANGTAKLAARDQMLNAQALAPYSPRARAALRIQPVVPERGIPKSLAQFLSSVQAGGGVDIGSGNPNDPASQAAVKMLIDGAAQFGENAKANPGVPVPRKLSDEILNLPPVSGP